LTWSFDIEYVIYAVGAKQTPYLLRPYWLPVIKTRDQGEADQGEADETCFAPTGLRDLQDGGRRTKERVFIAIGSNLGDRAANCRKAAGLLGRDNSRVCIVALSALYESEPWGIAGQAPFLNLVAEVATALAPAELLARLKEIEDTLGRVVTERWGPRLIDLDIVYYGARVIREEGLTIPHPHAHERGFVLAPLAEIAPDFVDPVRKETVVELLALLKEDGIIRRLDAVGGP